VALRFLSKNKGAPLPFLRDIDLLFFRVATIPGSKFFPYVQSSHLSVEKMMDPDQRVFLFSFDFSCEVNTLLWQICFSCPAFTPLFFFFFESRLDRASSYPGQLFSCIFSSCPLFPMIATSLIFPPSKPESKSELVFFFFWTTPVNEEIPLRGSLSFSRSCLMLGFSWFRYTVGLQTAFFLLFRLLSSICAAENSVPPGRRGLPLTLDDISFFFSENPRQIFPFPHALECECPPARLLPPPHSPPSALEERFLVFL